MAYAGALMWLIVGASLAGLVTRVAITDAYMAGKRPNGYA